MSGKYGLKGYMYQSITAIIEALSDDNWDSIKIEPQTKDDKIDISLIDHEKVIRSIQVKSSINKFGSGNIKKWLHELCLDQPDGKHELILVGSKYTEPARRYINQVNSRTDSRIIKTIECSHEEIIKLVIGNIFQYISLRHNIRSITPELLDDAFVRLFSAFSFNGINDYYFTRDNLNDLFISVVTNRVVLPVGICCFGHWLTVRPTYNHFFYGRTSEINEINNLLNDNETIVIGGIGGIGKTETAKRFLEQHEKEYVFVGWIDYKDNWKQSLVNSVFLNGLPINENMSLEKRYNLLVEALTNIPGNLMLVVDNYDPDENQDIESIIKIPGKKLITSRLKIEGITYYTLCVPSLENCENIFKKYYSHKTTLNDDYYIRNIIQCSHNYILAIELIAKAIKYSHMPIQHFEKKLSEMDYNFKFLDEVAFTEWNNPFVLEKVYDQIRKVYDLSNLSHEEQCIVQLMSILPPVSIINVKQISKWGNIKANQYIQLLENKGWLNNETGGCSMHEIICSCIAKYYPIEYKACNYLLEDLIHHLKLGSGINTLKELKYAVFVKNILKVKKGEKEFAKHEMSKDAALVFKELGRYNESISILEYVQQFYDEMDMVDCFRLAEIHNNISKIYSIQSKLGDSLEHALKADTLIDSIEYEELQQKALSPSCSTFYTKKMVIKKTLGMNYAHLREYRDAILKMEEAKQYLAFISDEERYYVANFFSDYSLLLFDIGDVKGSVDYYKKTLEMYDELNILEYNPWRNTTYTNYADSLILSNKNADALYYEYLALIGKFKTFPKDNLAIANALLGLGKIFLAEKRMWDIAKVIFERTAKIYYDVRPNSGGYCDSLSCLALITKDERILSDAFEIIIRNSPIAYGYDVCINLMEAALEIKPEIVLVLGEHLNKHLLEISDRHVALQYNEALMAKANQKLGNEEAAKKHLSNALKLGQSEEFYYNIKAKTILSNI